MSELPTIDIPDVQRELDWLIVVRTCEWCGTVMDEVLKREWRCRKTGHTKHWKAWRTCLYCACKASGKWVIPLIKNMAEMPLIGDIMAVQPMNQPAGDIFYMDFVYEAPRPRQHIEINMTITSEGVYDENWRKR